MDDRIDWGRGKVLGNGMGNGMEMLRRCYWGMGLGKCLVFLAVEFIFFGSG